MVTASAKLPPNLTSLHLSHHSCPGPPSAVPPHPRYVSPSSLLLCPNQSYRPCEICVNRAVLHCTRTMIDQDSIWILSSSFTSLTHLSIRNFPLATCPCRPQPPPLSLLIFRSLHPGPCCFPEKLISCSPGSSPFPGIETHYRVSVGKTVSVQGLTLQQDTELEKAFLSAVPPPYSVHLCIVFSANGGMNIWN